MAPRGARIVFLERRFPTDFRDDSDILRGTSRGFVMAFKIIRRSSFVRVAGLVLAMVATAQSQRPCSAVESVLGPSWDTAASYQPLNIVLAWGERDSGRPLTDHNWPQFATEWETLLKKVPNATVSRAYYFPSDQQWGTADVIVLYLRTHTFRVEAPTDLPSPPAAGSYTWGAAEFAKLDAYLQRGGGLVIMHSATYPDVSFENEWVKRAGLAWKQGTTTYREGNLVIRKEAGMNGHPIMFGMPDTMHFLDETYYPMMKTPDSATAPVLVLASTNETFQGVTAPRPALWTFSPPGKPGRVYGFIMGHLNASFNDPLFRGILMRGMAWVGNTEFSRFRPAVYSGATYSGQCSAPVALRPALPATSPAAPRLEKNKALFEWKGKTRSTNGRVPRAKGGE
jgi:type 1 glutamine amidotransferase